MATYCLFQPHGGPEKSVSSQKGLDKSELQTSKEKAAMNAKNKDSNTGQLNKTEE